MMRPDHAAHCHLLDAGAPAATFTPPPATKTETPGDRSSIGEAPLVTVRDLCVSYRARSGLKALLPGNVPSIDVLIDVSLDLRKGETLGLVGESGSGKTTLGRSILGLVPVKSGSVKLEGRELTGLSEADAEVQLSRCGGELKTAVVAHRHGVTAEVARELLARAGGQLRIALENPTGGEREA